MTVMSGSVPRAVGGKNGEPRLVCRSMMDRGSNDPRALWFRATRVFQLSTAVWISRRTPIWHRVPPHLDVGKNVTAVRVTGVCGKHSYRVRRAWDERDTYADVEYTDIYVKRSKCINTVDF